MHLCSLLLAVEVLVSNKNLLNEKKLKRVTLVRITYISCRINLMNFSVTKIYRFVTMLY
jgi:hypothetical protein